MGEIRNARCLLFPGQWNQYADQQVDPMGRSLTRRQGGGGHAFRAASGLCRTTV